jgi:hypothetical protein
MGHEVLDMNALITAYALYLLLSIPLAVVVARTLSRQGRIYLTRIFDGDLALAESINQLLLVGFYLVSLGFVALWLSTDATVVDVRGVFEMLSAKLGTVALALGAIHLFNVLVFNGIRRRREASEYADRPIAATYPAR